MVTAAEMRRRHKEKRRPKSYADGGSVLSDEDVGIAPSGRIRITISPKDKEPPQEAPAQPSGLSDAGVGMAPVSGFQKAVEPITSYPATYMQMNKEAREQMSRGLGQVASPESGWDVAKGVGNLGLGALNYATSPINAGLRTVVGQPLEENFGIPKEYSEFAASLALPGIGMKSAMPTVPSVPGAASKAQQVAQAADRMGVKVPRAAVTESIPLRTSSAAVKEVPVVGTPLVKASKEAAEGIENAVGRTADTLGSGQIYQAGEAAKGGIENWITSTGSKIADRIYGWERTINPNVMTDLSSTRNAAANIIARNQSAGLGQGRAVGEIADALMTPGGLSYDGIKRLRTHIGELSGSGILPEGMSKGELKQIYGALTDDLRTAAGNAGGPNGLRSFDRASALYGQLRDKQNAVAKIIGVDANAPAEAVMSRLLQMSNGKGSGDIIRLTQARRAMGPDAWNEVTSSVINKMGRTAESGEFSGDKFVTAWDNMSDAGRKLLFNSTGNPGTAQAVEDLVTLSRAHKQLKALGNPSGTGRVASLSGLATMAWAEPITALSTALTGNVFARVMARPVTAKAATNWASAYVNAAKNPSPISKMVLAQNTNNLAASIGKTLGIDPAAVIKGFQGAVPVRADEESEQ